VISHSRRFAALLTACMLGHAAAQHKEVLYSLDSNSGARLQVHDQSTGGITRSVFLTPSPVTQTGLAWDASGLVVKGQLGGNGARLIKCHPADATTTHLPSIGPPWQFVAMDVDPSTGQAVVVLLDQPNGRYYLGTIDTVSGSLTLGPVITPLGNWIAMAIDSLGVIVLARASGQTFFYVDPVTGFTTAIGSTSVPNGLCQDLAYDSHGQLWGVFSDVFGGPNTGIYRLDLSALSATLFSASPVPYYGVAFGHETDSQVFCTAKATSLSCVPSISGNGFASPNGKLGFTIGCDNVNNNKPGLLLYGTSGQASLPFQGGLLCVQSPMSRSASSSSGGAAPPVQNCSGRWSIDYNAMIWAKYHFVQTSTPTTAPASAFLVPGTVVQCQWWGRDPGFAVPNNSMLSDGLEFTLAP